MRVTTKLYIPSLLSRVGQASSKQSSSARLLPGPAILSVGVVQSLSRVRRSSAPWPAACQTPPPSAISWSLLKRTSIESGMPSNRLILCHPLLLLPSIFPSIRVFSNELTFHIRWPKYWCFSFSISSANEYSGLISFRTNWFDLLDVQGTLCTRSK